MVKFNLLPWREYQAIYEKAVLQRMIIVAGLSGCVLSICVCLLLIFLTHHTKSHAARLRAQLDELAPLHVRMQEAEHQSITQHVTEKLAVYRQDINNLMLELNRTSADTVCFSELTRQHDTIIFTGYARSGIDLADFLRAWHGVTLFTEIHVDAINQTANGVQFQFSAQTNHPIVWEQSA